MSKLFITNEATGYAGGRTVPELVAYHAPFIKCEPWFAFTSRTVPELVAYHAPDPLATPAEQAATLTAQEDEYDENGLVAYHAPDPLATPQEQAQAAQAQPQANADGLTPYNPPDALATR